MMKTKYLFLTTILLLGLSISSPAQTESGSFDGIQNSLNQFADAAAETFESLKQQYDEFIRIGMLLGSDIRMSMNAKFEGDFIGMVITGPWGLSTTDHTGSLYAEFDWQNMQESIRSKSSEYITGLHLGDETNAVWHKENEAQDYYMYIDALGYWYVPVDMKHKVGRASVTIYNGYLRVDPMGGMQNVAKMLEFSIEAAIDAKVTEMLDQLAVLAIMETKSNKWLKDFIPNEMIEAYIGSSDSDISVMEEKLKPILKDLAKWQLEQISGFPAFIHFAFIISPTLARSQFDVNEETITSGGQVVLTKMTIASGPDAGYLIVFDQYGRLIHLKDTEGDTADYWYDKDVTVNIPPAITIDLGSLIKLNRQN